MGNASYRQTTGNQLPQDLRNYFQADLPKFILQSKIGNGKFMKTYVMRVDGAPVVVKVYLRLNDEDLQVPVAKLTHIWKVLTPAKYPNLLTYQLWMRSSSRVKSASSPTYLIRQYFTSNLHDRLLTRPFLNELEKLWIVYQLFKCLETCHEQDMIHGDIKPENVMYTSSNWVILTDFSPFKPTAIPDDDPTDFQYFFDSMGRHRCYVAPERFYRRGVKGNWPRRTKASSSFGDFKLFNEEENSEGGSRQALSATPGAGLHPSVLPLTPAMDIFSLGCVTAELFLDGVPLLDLPGMLQYVSAEVSSSSDDSERLDTFETPAKTLLGRIKNGKVREAIIDMTLRDPTKRLSVKRYLEVLTERAPSQGSAYSPKGISPIFPTYFESSLYPLFLRMHWHGTTPDDRVRLVCESYGEIMEQLTGQPDHKGSDFFPTALRRLEDSSSSTVQHAPTQRDDESSGVTARNNRSGSISVPVFDLQQVASASETSLSERDAPSRMSQLDQRSNSRRRESLAMARSRSTLSSDELKDDSTAEQRCKQLQGRHLNGIELFGKDINDFKENADGDADPVTQFVMSNGIYDPEKLALLDTDGLIKLSRELISSTEKQLQPKNVSSSAQVTVTEGPAPIHRKQVLSDAAKLAEARNAKASVIINADVMRMSLDRKHCEEEVFNSAALLQEALLGHAASRTGGVGGSGGTTQHIDSFFDLDAASKSCSRGADEKRSRIESDGLVLIISVICACFRHLKYPQAKQVSVMLLVRLGHRSSDSVILERVIPTLLVGVEDQSPPVRAISIRAIRSMLMTVEELHHAETNFFPMYIFPALSRVAKDPEIFVRVAFAESIGRIAETAKRFLDRAHQSALMKCVAEYKSSSSDVPVGESALAVEFAYDGKLEALKDHVGRWIRDLIIDAGNSVGIVVGVAKTSSLSNSGNAAVSFDSRKGSSFVSYGSVVKRALLADIMRLCTFFGQEATMDKLLTQLLTFLNDQDWELRYAFCSRIPLVCAFLGPTITSECILPCIENAIYDVEERVVVCAIDGLTALVQLSLMSSLLLVEFAQKCKPLLVHPSEAIKMSTIHFLHAASVVLGKIDTAVFILPIIRDILQYDLSGTQLTQEILVHDLVPCVSRESYRAALIRRVSAINAQQSTQSEHTANNSSGKYPVASKEQLSLSFTPPMPPRSKSLAELTDADRVGSDNQAEMQKLEVLSPYLDQAAKEINTKALQWRNGIVSITNSYNTPFGSTSVMHGNLITAIAGSSGNQSFNTNILKSSGTRNSLESLLDFSNVPMPEHSLQSLLIPHQKYGIFYFPTLSEDVHRENILIDSNDGMRNVAKLRLLFGISGGQADAARAIAAGVGDQWEPAVNASGNVTVAPSTGVYNNPNNFNAAYVSTGSIASQQAPNSPPASGNFSVRSPGVSRPNLKRQGSDPDRTPTTDNAAYSMNAVKMRIIHPAFSESITLLRRIRALRIPPLPPDMGTLLQPDGRKYSSYLEPLDLSTSYDAAHRSNWRPKENVLLCTLREHAAAVNRIAVSPDQAYFATASTDRTVKVWLTKNLDRVAFPRSIGAYSKHKAAVVDLAAIDNSHSLVSSSSDGSLHVWRVDMTVATSGGVASTTANTNHVLSGNYYDMIGSTYDGIYNGVATNPTAPETHGAAQQTSNNLSRGTSVSGTTNIKKLDLSKEGFAQCVQHYNSGVCSVVAYATQKGGVYGWDLRGSSDAFHFQLRPELGYPTSMSMAPDKHWMCLGTSKGYVALWDVRFNTMCKLWKHSSGGPVHRMVACKSLPRSLLNNATGTSIGYTEGAYMFLSAGYNNEAAVWGIPEAGECYKCFRTIPLDASRNPVTPLPTLRDIALPRHPDAPILEAVRANTAAAPQVDGGEFAIRAMLGRIPQSNAVVNAHLITAGTDRAIRYWDFNSSSKCFTACGLEAAQPRSIFDSPKLPDGSTNKLFICYATSTPSSEKMMQAHLPIREARGVNLPSTNFKDAITDLKTLDIPLRLMVSGSRDGEVKLWR